MPFLEQTDTREIGDFVQSRKPYFVINFKNILMTRKSFVSAWIPIFSKVVLFGEHTFHGIDKSVSKH